MKSIKNIFLLNAVAMYSMHFSSFGTVLLAALFSTAAGETSYNVPAGAGASFECASGTGDKCCSADFRDNIGGAGSKQTTNTAEGTCMTGQGEFKHCEEQSNCTVTCSAGCTGKTVEENSGHDSSGSGSGESNAANEGTPTATAQEQGVNEKEDSVSDHNSTELGVSTLSDCVCDGYGPCDCNSSGCSGSGCISKSEVITLAMATVGILFAAVFLAI